MDEDVRWWVADWMIWKGEAQDYADISKEDVLRCRRAVELLRLPRYLDLKGPDIASLPAMIALCREFHGVWGLKTTLFELVVHMLELEVAAMNP